MGVFQPILAPRKKPVYTEEDVKAPRDRKLGHCGGPRKKAGGRSGRISSDPWEPRWTSGELKIVPSGYD